MGERPELKNLAQALRLPCVLEIKSGAFESLMGPDWAARNPIVALFLLPEEVEPGKPLDLRAVGKAVERVLARMSPLDDKVPEFNAVRAVYRDIFLKLVPDFRRRFEADLAVKDLTPAEGIRLVHIGLNCWPTDPRKDPKAKRLWALGAVAFAKLGMSEMASLFSEQTRSMPEPDASLEPS